MNRFPTRLSHAASAAVFAVTLLGATAAFAVDLTVEVLDTRPGTGTVHAALYASPDAWLKSDQVLQGARQEATERTVLVFRNLTPGRYALAAFLDDNGNGKLDRNAAGTPRERMGFSRDALGFMGPPAFPDAAFELNENTTLTVRLR